MKRTQRRTESGRAVVSAILIGMALAGGAVWLWRDRTPAAPTRAEAPISAAVRTPTSQATAPTVPSRPATRETVAPTSPIELDLRLVATVVRRDRARSFAAVARRDGTDSELVSVGEPVSFLADVHVVEIGQEFADVVHAGQRVRFTTSSHLDPLAEAFLEAVRAAPARRLSPEERARRADLVDRLRARMQAGPGSGHRIEGDGLFAEGRVSAQWEGDALVAIEIEDIERGSFYEAIGLQNGDRIVGINGIAIGEPDAAGRILKELVTADTIVADVEGQAGSEEISVPSNELVDQLRERFSGLTPEDREAIESLPISLPGDAASPEDT